MNHSSLVSVVIPFYNRFDLLKNTLLSVKNQVYNNYEVILIDDCSELQLDVERIEKLFQNHRVIYRRLERNSGPGLARSIGREMATGKYVAYLDSDDLWEPRFLTSTVDKLEEHPDISMAFTNVLINHGERNIRRLKIQDGIYNFYDLIFNKKRYWATGAALWRSKMSLSSNWKQTRDHEDYVHDILSLQFNPLIFHISETLCVVNKNAVLGIKRSNLEMLKSMNELLKSNTLFENLNQYGLSENFKNFILWRISKRNYRLNECTWIFKTYRNLLRWPGNYLIFTLKFSEDILKKPYWVKRLQSLSRKFT